MSTRAKDWPWIVALAIAAAGALYVALRPSVARAAPPPEDSVPSKGLLDLAGDLATVGGILGAGAAFLAAQQAAIREAHVAQHFWRWRQLMCIYDTAALLDWQGPRTEAQARAVLAHVALLYIGQGRSPFLDLQLMAINNRRRADKLPLSGPNIARDYAEADPGPIVPPAGTTTMDLLQGRWQNASIEAGRTAWTERPGWLWDGYGLTYIAKTHVHLPQGTALGYGATSHEHYAARTWPGISQAELYLSGRPAGQLLPGTRAKLDALLQAIRATDPVAHVYLPRAEWEAYQAERGLHVALTGEQWTGGPADDGTAALIAPSGQTATLIW